MIRHFIERYSNSRPAGCCLRRNTGRPFLITSDFREKAIGSKHRFGNYKQSALTLLKFFTDFSKRPFNGKRRKFNDFQLTV